MFRSMRSLVSPVVVGLRQVPGKAKRGEVLQKNRFLLRVRLVAALHLSLLFKKVLRSLVREEVVEIAVMPQFFKGDTNNNLIVCMYRALALAV